jgi:2-methylisocitrate lyase-like PEP mutase family enzyme
MVITYFAVGDLSLSTVTDDLNELNDQIQKLIDLGVAGINLEDAQGEDIYLKKLNLFINLKIAAMKRA